MQKYTLPYQFRIFVVLCLLTCNMLIQAFFPNIVINFIGFGILVFIIFEYTRRNHNQFKPFLLLLFLLSNFRLLENQGGGWNLVALPFLLLFYFNGNYGNDVKKNQSIIVLMSLIFILTVSNILGWIFENPLSPSVKIQNAFQFVSYLIVLILLARTKFTFSFFSSFIKIVAVINVYAFFVSLNQVFGVLQWTSPIFGADSYYFKVLRPFSLYGDFELYAEYSLLIFVFSFLLLIANRNDELDVSKKLLSFNLVFAFLNILISGTRSSLILSLFIIPIAFLFSLKRNALFHLSFKTLFLIVALSILTFVIFNQLKIEETIFDRMSGLGGTHFTLSNIFSGETINRDKPYEEGYYRINSHSWYLGYGSGILKSNLAAWWGTTDFTTVDDLPMFDFHSLYLCIPMIYGWFGSGAFFLIFLFMMVGLWNVFQNSAYNNSFRAIANSLFALWLFFFLNEFKINYLRGASYQMLIWIWLGISYSVIFSKKHFLVTNPE